jgi:transposase
MVVAKRKKSLVRGGRSRPSQTLREKTRAKGYQLLKQGKTRAEVANQLGVSWVTANTWQNQLKTKQAKTTDKPRSGRPPKLTPKQTTKLKNILKKGAQHYGYPTQLWTLKRVTAVIEKEFNIKYNPTHVWRVLRSLGFSAQIPLLKAMERNEKTIKEWINVHWPQITALAKKENAVILFYDESCVQSQPNVRKTWAPRGKRPEIRVRQGRRDKLSLVSAVTWDGDLFFSVHDHNLTDKDTARFLCKLKKELAGRKFVVLWDGLIIHRSKRVQRFLGKHAGQIIPRRFPAYAPELNPDEQVWKLAKHDDLANWCPANKAEMRRVIVREMRKLKSEKTRVARALRHAKIPLPPL